MAVEATPLRVVVLGGGFGGLAVVRGLADFPGEVVLVDRQNHHLFQPLLYQVATAGLSGSDIAQPLRMIVAGQENVSVVMDEAISIDCERKQVKLRERTLDYTYLVVAVGMTNNYFGHDEWSQHALAMKSLSEAAVIRNRLLQAYEQAETESDADRRRALLSTVVIGGGATGVELSGAAQELGLLLRRDFRRIQLGEPRVILVEGGPRLLPAFAPELSENACKSLEAMGVEVWLNTRVLDIRHGEVWVERQGKPDVVPTASKHTLHAQTILWAAGVRAEGLTKTLGVALDRGGRVLVEPDCRVPGHREVFAIGDCMSLKDSSGEQVPGLAQGAMQTGAYVAAAIMADRPTAKPSTGSSAGVPFRYKDLGTMATIGRKAAVAQIGRLQLTGVIAWLAWLFLHLVLLIDLRSKASVFVQWISGYVRYRPGARIIYARSVETNPQGVNSGKVERKIS